MIIQTNVLGGDVMYNYSDFQERYILCLSHHNFFANVSCVSKGINPNEYKLAVISDTKRQGAIVISATEPLQELGIKTGSRLFEIPHRNDIFIINPNMKQYINYANAIYKVLLNYVHADDIQQHHVDEIFIDVTDYYKQYCDNPIEFAARIRTEIEQETQLNCHIGIGPNMLLSKLALDNESYQHDQLIGVLNYSDIRDKVWPIHPLHKVWGINDRLEKELNELGLYTVGDLARYPVNKLTRLYGTMGKELNLISNGIDTNIVREIHSIYNPDIKCEVALEKQYQYYEMKEIILQQVERLTKQLRSRNLLVKTIAFSLKSNANTISKSYTLKDGTNITMDIFRVIWSFTEQLCDKHEQYSALSISLTQLVPERARELNLFIDTFERERDEALALLTNEMSVNNTYSRREESNHHLVNHK